MLVNAKQPCPVCGGRSACDLYGATDDGGIADLYCRRLPVGDEFDANITGWTLVERHRPGGLWHSGPGGRRRCAPRGLAPAEGIKPPRDEEEDGVPFRSGPGSTSLTAASGSAP